MRYIQHPSNNTVFGAPQGVSHEDCSALPATKVQYDNGVKAIWSYWKPTEAEKAAIMADKPIILSLWGEVMIPVSLMVEGVDT